MVGDLLKVEASQVRDSGLRIRIAGARQKARIVTASSSSAVKIADSYDAGATNAVPGRCALGPWP